jgi:glycosyltransferase involved in cell wall biosynthesis
VVQRVRPRIPRARFFILGDGREAAQIREAAATLDGAVTLLGHDEDVPGFLAAMDVMVQPSRQEAMAQTTLEAMSAGLPLVSTDTVGTDEAIDDDVSGLLVPVGDVDALGDAIVALVVDPARRERLGAAARARVLRDFSLAHALDRCETALEQIARR